MTYQHLCLKTRSFVGWIKNYVVELHFKEYFSYIWLLHVFAYSQRVDMLDDVESFKSTLPPPPPPRCQTILRRIYFSASHAIFLRTCNVFIQHALSHTMYSNISLTGILQHIDLDGMTWNIYFCCFTVYIYSLF